jgi:hypothetical protein
MFQESLLMYQESLFSCQAWQAATNPKFKFGNAPGHEKEKVTVADTPANSVFARHIVNGVE